MGSVDLICIATGLPILTEKARCVFFFLVGGPGAWQPVSLPLGGVWNGNYPELDPGWHRAGVLAGLASLAQPDARDRAIDARSRDVLLDIVAATFSGARPVRTPSGEAVTFRAALEDFYRVFASEASTPDRPAGESARELCAAALPRDVLVAPVYASAPEEDLRPASLDFLRFRAWFEANRAWGATDDGHQLERDDVEAMIDHAERWLLEEPPPRRARLAAAMAAYRARGQAEDEDESDDDDDDDDPSAGDGLEKTVGFRILVEHLRAKVRERPGIDAAALAGTIEVFRTLKALPPSLLPAGKDFATNKERWRKVIERVGTADLPALVRALRATPSVR
jgi:hypothetical protein